MYPSEIRAHFLEGQSRLRRLLGEALDLARRARAGERALAGRLVDMAERITGMVFRLIDEEEDLLPPALLQADAWDEVRVERMYRYHRQWRSAVLSLLRQVHGRRLPPARLAEELEELVEELEQGLCRAERTLLHPDVLRDDPIVIGQIDG